MKIKKIWCKNCKYFDSMESLNAGNNERCSYKPDISYDPVEGEIKTNRHCRIINRGCNCKDFKKAKI